MLGFSVIVGAGICSLLTMMPMDDKDSENSSENKERNPEIRKEKPTLMEILTRVKEERK